MKKYARKLSIVLTLVLILTSFGFTGVFANVNDGVDADQLEAAEPAAADADQLEAADADQPEVTDADQPEATDANLPEATDADQPEATDADQPGDADAETFTITWKLDDGTVLREDKVAKDATPDYGETPVKPEDENYIYEFEKWDPEVAPATADAEYTAVFTKKSKGFTKPAAPVVEKNKEGKAYASYKSVHIVWAPVTKDADGVEYAEGVTVKYRVKAPKSPSIKFYKVSDTEWRTGKTLKPFSTYTFTVEAYVVNAEGEEVTSSATTIKGSPFKSIRYRLKIKEGSTLKRHAGNGPKSYKLGSGVTIDTDRFQTGKYIFEYKGSIFYISQTRVRSASALYNHRGTWNYTNKEAEYYIKDRGMGSATKNMIFVNTFCQHAYFFEKKDGKWDCTDSWECGTGLASTPTPTGNYGKKYIHARKRSKNNIQYWNLFNGNAALHGTKPNDKRVGLVISNGCVRNPVEKAKKIYTQTKLKTRVLIV